MTIYTGARAGNGATAAAFVQGSTWGTAVAVGASKGIRITSESIRGGAARLERVTLGLPWGDKPDQGAEMSEGSIEGDLFYGARCGNLMAYVLGTSPSPTQTPPSTGTTYLHVSDLANGLAKFFTLVLARKAQASDSALWDEYASAMMARLTIRGSGNGRVTWAAELVCGKLSLASSTNTATETDAVTVPDPLAAVRFVDGIFRLNAQAGGSLSSGDKVSLSGFELEIMRPLSKDFLLDGTKAVSQPGEEDACMVKLSVDLQSYNATTYKTAWAAGTEYKADLKFSSGVTPSGGAELYHEFQLPRLVMEEDPQANLAGRGRVSHRVTFKAIKATTAPTGMTGVTQPVRLNTLDADTAAYLA